MMKKILSTFLATVITLMFCGIAVSAAKAPSVIKITEDEYYSITFDLGAKLTEYDETKLSITKSTKNGKVSFKMVPKMAGNSKVVFSYGGKKYTYTVKVAAVTDLEIGSTAQSAIQYNGKLKVKYLKGSKELIAANLTETKGGYVLSVKGKKQGKATMYLYSGDTLIATLYYKVTKPAIPEYTVSGKGNSTFSFTVPEKFSNLWTEESALGFDIISIEDRTVKLTAKAKGSYVIYTINSKNEKIAKIIITIS